MEIRIPFDPQPIKDEDGMWKWRDCQWMDQGIGFPASGIEDHFPFRVGNLIMVDEQIRKVMFVAANQDKKGTWNWSVFIENPPVQQPATRVYRTGEELRNLASEVAKKVTIRTYVEYGNSKDVERSTTKEEYTILRDIIHSALLSLNNSEQSRRAQYGDPVFKAVLDTAEYMSFGRIPGINSYNSIYIPVWNIIKAWPLESEETE